MKNILRLSVLHGWFFISDALGPEGRVRTSRRMSAKKKSHDAMFFVNTATPALRAWAGPNPPVFRFLAASFRLRYN